MANKRNANTFYIDTQYSAAADELAVKNVRVTHIIATSTGVNATCIIADSSVADKIEIRIAADDTTQIFDFADNPIVFSTSIRPTTLTNMHLTCIINESRG